MKKMMNCLWKRIHYFWYKQSLVSDIHVSEATFMESALPLLWSHILMDSNLNGSHILICNIDQVQCCLGCLLIAVMDMAGQSRTDLILLLERCSNSIQLSNNFNPSDLNQWKRLYWSVVLVYLYHNFILTGADVVSSFSLFCLSELSIKRPSSSSCIGTVIGTTVVL